MRKLAELIVARNLIESCFAPSASPMCAVTSLFLAFVFGETFDRRQFSHPIVCGAHRKQLKTHLTGCFGAKKHDYESATISTSSLKIYETTHGPFVYFC